MTAMTPLGLLPSDSPGLTAASSSTSTQKTQEGFESYFKAIPSKEDVRVQDTSSRLLVLIGKNPEDEEFWQSLKSPLDVFNVLASFLLLFEKPETMDELTKSVETMKSCWVCLQFIEQNFLKHIGCIIDSQTQRICDLSEEEFIHYQHFLKSFIHHFAFCTYAIYNLCQKKDFTISQVAGFPSLCNEIQSNEGMEIDKTIPPHLSPIVVLLGLTKEQLAQKKPTQTMQELLLPFETQLIQDFQEHPHLTECFNSGFALLRESIGILPLSHGVVYENGHLHFEDHINERSFVEQMVSALQGLAALNKKSSTHSIIKNYRDSFSFFPDVIKYKTIGRKSVEQLFLDLGYEWMEYGRSDKSPPCKSIRIDWKTEGDVTHGSGFNDYGEDAFIVNVSKQKIQPKPLSDWILLLAQKVKSLNSILLPYDMLVSFSHKRKREKGEGIHPSKRIKTDDSHSSSVTEEAELSNPVYSEERIAALDEDFFKILQTEQKHIVLTGTPNKLWDLHIFKRIGRAAFKSVEVPLESMYDFQSQIPAKDINEQLKGKLVVAFSFHHHAENEQKLELLLAYLNSLDCMEIVLTIEDKSDHHLLIKLIKNLKHKLKLNVDYEFRHDINLSSLLNELSDPLNSTVRSSEMIINILLPLMLSRLNPRLKPPSPFPELSSFLQNESHQNALNSFIESSLKLPEMGALLSLITKNPRDLILYPVFAQQVLHSSYEWLEKKQLFEPSDEFQDAFSDFLFYLLDKRLLTSEQLIEMRISREFLSFLPVMILRKPSREWIAQQLLPIANEILDYMLCEEDELLEVLLEFIKLGWFPPHEHRFTQSYRWKVILIPVLAKSLPHLNELKQCWVQTICELDIVETLDDEIQLDFVNLVNYHNFQKKCKFVLIGLSNIQLNHIIIKKYLELCLKNISYMSQLFDIINLGSYLFSYIMFLKTNFKLEDEEFVRYFFEVLIVTDNRLYKENLKFSVDQFLELFENQDILEKILTKTFNILKENDIKNMRVLLHMLIKSVLTEDAISDHMTPLCAKLQMLIYSGYSLETVNSNKLQTYRNSIWEALKEGGESQRFSTEMAINLWLILQEKYLASSLSSDGEDSNTLIDRGVAILQGIRGYDSAKIQDVLNFILDGLKFKENFHKQIIERLLLSPAFSENLKSWNAQTLFTIIERLPLLNDQLQKICFRLCIKDEKPCLPSDQWISCHPTFYNKFLKYVNKNHLMIEREIAMHILTIDCPAIEDKELEICFKKIQWTDLEFCYIYSKMPSIIKYLGRDLNEPEKLAVELSKYVVEAATDQSQLSVLGIQLQACIHNTKSSLIRRHLNLLPRTYDRNDLNYVQSEINKVFKIPSVDPLDYEENSVSIEVKQQAENFIDKLTFYFNSPLQIFKIVKDAIEKNQVQITKQNMIEWLKSNQIEEMNQQQLIKDFFENKKINTALLICILEKNNIIRKIK